MLIIVRQVVPDVIWDKSAVKDIKVNGKTQKLKSGTTYYVQIREIRKVGETNYIGNISCPVAMKAK